VGGGVPPPVPGPMRRSMSANSVVRVPLPDAWFEDGGGAVLPADRRQCQGRRYAGNCTHELLRDRPEPKLSIATTYAAAFRDHSGKADHVRPPATVYTSQRELDQLLAKLGGDPRRAAAAAMFRAQNGVTEQKKAYQPFTAEEMKAARGVSMHDLERRKLIDQIYRRAHHRTRAASKAQRAARRAARARERELERAIELEELELQRLKQEHEALDAAQAQAAMSHAAEVSTATQLEIPASILEETDELEKAEDQYDEEAVLAQALDLAGHNQVDSWRDAPRPGTSSASSSRRPSSAGCRSSQGSASSIGGQSSLGRPSSATMSLLSSCQSQSGGSANSGSAPSVASSWRGSWRSEASAPIDVSENGSVSASGTAGVASSKQGLVSAGSGSNAARLARVCRQNLERMESEYSASLHPAAVYVKASQSDCSTAPPSAASGGPRSRLSSASWARSAPSSASSRMRPQSAGVIRGPASVASSAPSSAAWTLNEAHGHIGAAARKPATSAKTVTSARTSTSWGAAALSSHAAVSGKPRGRPRSDPGGMAQAAANAAKLATAAATEAMAAAATARAAAVAVARRRPASAAGRLQGAPTEALRTAAYLARSGPGHGAAYDRSSGPATALGISTPV